MAQLGMLVPASKARYVACQSTPDGLAHGFVSLAPVDSILTRMGAYDNMFSNASTFKVELDEWYGYQSLLPSREAMLTSC